MKTILLLLDLRKAWKSKTLTFARILTLLPALDLGFFQGDTGVWIATKFMELVNLLPFLEIDLAQAVSFLVIVVGGFIAWLRKVTVQPIEDKL